MDSEKSQRVTLSIKTKYGVIRALSEPGATQASVDDRYGVSRCSVSKMWKSRVDITNLFCNEQKTDVKRVRLAKEIDIDEALFEWFRQKGSQGARISGPILIEKARQLAAADGKEFTPNSSWLQRWKVRHSVVWHKQQREKQDADCNAAETWTECIMPKLLDSFNPADIFNAD